MITDLRFSVASVSAVMDNFAIEKIKPLMHPVFPIVRVKCELFDRRLNEYFVDEPKSKRGRKKNPPKITKKFKSNISFVVRLTQFREGRNYTKLYNIRVFNGGKIVCVGILNQDKSDFYECIEAVRQYISKIAPLYFSDLDPPTADLVEKLFYNKIRVHTVKSTLENYQFSMGKSIDLYTLKEHFIKMSQLVVINVKFSNIYSFLAESITENIFTINAETVINGITLKDKAKTDFVNSRILRQELLNLDLEKISSNFNEYWLSFKERNGHRISDFFEKNLRFNMLKQYIIHVFKPIRIRCAEQADYVVNSVIFKESKNTLLVQKKIGDTNVNYRIFSTGVINIQGGNSYEISRLAKEKICTVITDQFLYDAHQPPMITWQQSLDPLYFDEETDDNIN